MVTMTETLAAACRRVIARCQDPEYQFDMGDPDLALVDAALFDSQDDDAIPELLYQAGDASGAFK